MKKIALIEDRYPRQRKFLEQNNINLDKYCDVLGNFIEEKASNILENISNDSFDLNEFDIIVCHKSVKNNTVILGNLKDYCKKSQKTLVLFSGGISVNYYDNSEFELLELNSKTFYSHNLFLFLESIKTNNEDIMMLCYGEQWKQNIVANVLEKTNLFIFDIKNSFENVANFQIDANLGKIDYKFYEPKEKIFDEIVQFKESLEKYFTLQLLQENTTQSVVIHHDNVCDLQIFNYPIKFIQSSDDIDTYISKEIINELKNKEFDTIFIKDNLTSNYLELYGLRVAYHIRLSNELTDKRFTPIVIISDFDENTLNRFTQEANILFTDGLYLCKNTKEDIKKYQSLELKGVTDYNKFINSIEVTPPKDTSGSHNIANKWSIYKWAELLDAKSDAINKNRSEMENELYFKYLKAKYLKNTNNSLEIIKPTEKGNILLIDDEWNKGWSDVLKNALQKDGLDFDTFEYDFKDKSNYNLIVQLNHKELKKQVEKSDVIVLDLRLLESDHENEDIDSYTGIKILQKIHEINAGIQVIMLTATSKSTILEKLYEKKILGYIKKEHPEDKNIDTVENINKFIKLVDKGLKRKYLKEVFNIQKSIRDILSNDIFEQYNLDLNFYEPFWIKLEKESTNIFDIIDNERENSFIYAMVSISSSLETILSIFINEQNMTFWDAEPYDCQYNALRCRISKLFEKFGSDKDFDMKKLIDKRNDYMHSRKLITVNSQEIISWFTKLFEMIEIIRNPPKIRKYEQDNLISLKDKFNN
jgi:CheY-like chemotaxis protein